MYFNQNNNFYHGIMFQHFHDNGIHSKGQGSKEAFDYHMTPQISSNMPH